MDADPTPSSPPTGAPLLTRGTLLLLLALVALPTVVGAAVWTYAAGHQVVPGLQGCALVRERAPQVECYGAEIRELVAADGLEATLVKVDEVALQQPQLAASCHLAWHPIGEKTGARHASRRSDYANIEPTTICQEGYFHGYSIGFLMAAPGDTLDVPKLVGDQCSIAQDSRDVLNCIHSFGHVIARRTSKDHAAGAAQCASPRYPQLPFAAEEGNAAAYRFQCYYGLSMERSLIDLKAGSTELDNCAGAPGGRDAKLACYGYLSARVGAMRDGLADGARACHDLAPEGELRDSCVRTFGQGLPSDTACSFFPEESERALCARSVGVEAID